MRELELNKKMFRYTYQVTFFAQLLEDAGLVIATQLFFDFVELRVKLQHNHTISYYPSPYNQRLSISRCNKNLLKKNVDKLPSDCE